ncbi:MAG: hypothetical protein IPL22_04855 [Bacteroidetes bacterium]|nr:hypothetical protein [Bacteroidota bacterium]
MLQIDYVNMGGIGIVLKVYGCSVMIILSKITANSRGNFDLKYSIAKSI